MAKRKVSENTAADAGVSENTAAEGDASVTTNGGATDPNYTVFSVAIPVVIGSALHNRMDGEAGDDKPENHVLDVRVTRIAAGNYAAAFGPQVSEGKKNALAAVRSVLIANGFADGKDFTLPAKADFDRSGIEPALADDAVADAWQVGSNSLAAAADDIRNQHKAIGEAEGATRAAWIGLGKAFNAARAEFDGHYADGETTETRYGAWLVRTFEADPAILDIAVANKGKTASAARAYALAPDDVLALFPAVNTALTFDKEVNKAVKHFAKFAATHYISGLDRTALPEGVADEAIGEVVSEALSDMAEAYEAEKAKPTETDGGAENAKRLKAVTVARWLATANAGKVNAQVRAYYAEARAEILAQIEAEAAEAAMSEDDKAARERATAVAGLVKVFPDKSVDDAVAHLFDIVVSHAEFVLIAELLAERCTDEAAARAAAAEAKAKAEESEAEGMA